MNMFAATLIAAAVAVGSLAQPASAGAIIHDKTTKSGAVGAEYKSKGSAVAPEIKSKAGAIGPEFRTNKRREGGRP